MIAAELFERVVAAVTADAEQADLRRRFPGLPITVCNDDDIPARAAAARETAVARFYYVAPGEHCTRLCDDAESASGIVVGLIDED